MCIGDRVVRARAATVQHSTKPEGVLRGLSGAAGCVRFGVFTGRSGFVGATPELHVARDARGAGTEAVAGLPPRRGLELAGAPLFPPHETALRAPRPLVHPSRAPPPPFAGDVLFPGEPLFSNPRLPMRR